MRARDWFDWHSWIGVTAGLLLFVICWSGTVAVFSTEIDWLLDPARRVEPSGEQRSWGEWREAVEKKYPQARVDSIIAPADATSAVEVWIESPDGRTLRTYVDPYTAQVTGQTSYFNVQRFFRSLHMCLFDPGGVGVGYYFVLAFSLILLGSLVTSLVFYKRWWRRFFVLNLASARAFWSDLHKLAGVWSLWFVVLMVFTTLWYLIEFTGVDLSYPEIDPVERAASSDPVLSTDELLRRARAAAPDLQLDQVYVPGGYYGDVALFHGQGESILVRNRANVVMIDARSGEPLMIRPASQLGWPARWVDTADPLHFGNFAGLVSKTIWFVFGLLLSSLMLTGAYLHVRRQRRHVTEVRRTPAILAAYATTAVVLVVASVAAVGEIREYGAPAPSASVSIFIGAWLVLTLAALALWIAKLR